MPMVAGIVVVCATVLFAVVSRWNRITKVTHTNTHTHTHTHTHCTIQHETDPDYRVNLLMLHFSFDSAASRSSPADITSKLYV